MVFGEIMAQKRGIDKKKAIDDLKKLHKKLRRQIIKRLSEFNEIWENGTEEDIFIELVFCLLTPQSKAKSCHSAVCDMIDKDLILNGNQKQISKILKSKTRFHNTKAQNIVKARNMFFKNGQIAIRERISKFGGPFEARESLVNNIKGMGYKEASHFLRNIGLGNELAILDRHILKNLVVLGIIKEIPTSLSKKRYLEIEAEMKKFAENIKIPMAHLDLLLWYTETKEIFK